MSGAPPLATWYLLATTVVLSHHFRFFEMHHILHVLLRQPCTHTAFVFLFLLSNNFPCKLSASPHIRMHTPHAEEV